MSIHRLFTAGVLGIGLLVFAVPQPLSGQVRQNRYAAYESRSELQEREVLLQDRLAGLDRGSDEWKRVEAQLTRVRMRLQEGDFRPGDAVEVSVAGSDTLSGVFRVESGDRLRLPVIGDVDVSGVLYAEADSVLTEELSRYVKTDRIEVRPLKRVAVLGAVGSPGYYDVPPSITVSDLVMKAGGPTQSSDIEKIEIRRDGETVASAEQGLRESATLAELGVERGDQIRVPASRGGSSFRTIVGVIGSITGLAFAASRIF